MVEKESGTPDISIYDSCDGISHVRLSYYKLCTMFMPKWEYREIAQSLGRSCPSSIGLSVRRFNDLKNENKLLSLDIYNKCYKELKQMYKDSLKAEKMNVEYETV